MIKVVWICHFTNNRIQKILQLKKRVPEFAPWITLGIEFAKKHDDIELHIISPHRWISFNKEFKFENVNYHFFNSGIPLYGRHWPSFFRYDLFTNFYSNKKRIKEFVEKINPDIIHMHGFENSYYSSAIFQFINKYPLLVTVQGFISLQLPQGKISANTKNNFEVEIEILRRLDNFGIRTDDMKKEILKYNSGANFFWHEYFMNIPQEDDLLNSSLEKIYDLIYFARISKNKGIEDLIISTGLLKKTFPNIKTAVIGEAKPTYIEILKGLAIRNHCLENIHFIGFLPVQNDIYKYLSKSKVCVLPTYNDTLPGTIVESMFRKIPIVSYNTGGIPELSQNNTNILLAQQGDIKELSLKISELLNDDKLRAKIANNAYTYAIKRWNNYKVLNDLIKIYDLIIKKEGRK